MWAFWCWLHIHLLLQPFTADSQDPRCHLTQTYLKQACCILLYSFPPLSKLLLPLGCSLTLPPPNYFLSSAPHTKLPHSHCCCHSYNNPQTIFGLPSHLTLLHPSWTPHISLPLLKLFNTLGFFTPSCTGGCPLNQPFSFALRIPHNWLAHCWRKAYILLPLLSCPPPLFCFSSSKVQAHTHPGSFHNLHR